MNPEDKKELIQQAAVIIRSQESTIYHERATKSTPPIETTEAWKVAQQLERMITHECEVCEKYGEVPEFSLFENHEDSYLHQRNELFDAINDLKLSIIRAFIGGEKS